MNVFSTTIHAFLRNTPNAHAQTISDAPSALNTVSEGAGVAQTTVPVYAGTVIEGALLLVGTLFFILMLYAGFRWMTARGQEDAIAKARGTVVAAVIRLVVVVGSYAITNFVTDRIIEGNPNDGTNTDFTNADFTTQGCCFDRVRSPGSDVELRATTWQWRITSRASCEQQGTTPSSFDELYGPGDWQFQEVSSADQCLALYEDFCQSTDCYDLGF